MSRSQLPDDIKELCKQAATDVKTQRELIAQLRDYIKDLEAQIERYKEQEATYKSLIEEYKQLNNLWKERRELTSQERELMERLIANLEEQVKLAQKNKSFLSKMKDAGIALLAVLALLRF